MPEARSFHLQPCMEAGILCAGKIDEALSRQVLEGYGDTRLALFISVIVILLFVDLPIK